MLTRVFIDNFRSFVNFEYRPGRKQLLLGPNGSGKSSLLTALRYLKVFVKGESNEFTQSTRTRWRDSPAQVVEIEASLEGRLFEYRVEVGTAEQSVNLERLSVAGAVVFELAGGQLRLSSQDGNSKAIPLQTNRSALHLSVLSNSDVARFAQWLDHVHCFDIDIYPGEMSEIADRDEREPDFEMGNLADWYRYLLQTHPDQNLRFIESLRGCLDGFQTLRFSSQEDGYLKLRADFSGPTKKRVSYSLSELSDGQRKLIALYMILHFSVSRGDTVFIDEPDNFLSLREIQPWLSAAEQAVEDHDGQLILVSHHPEILNQWARDYGLRFFREENGQVRAKKFEAEQNAILLPSEVVARGWE